MYDYGKFIVYDYDDYLIFINGDNSVLKIEISCFSNIDFVCKLK